MRSDEDMFMIAESVVLVVLYGSCCPMQVVLVAHHVFTCPLM